MKKRVKTGQFIKSVSLLLSICLFVWAEPGAAYAAGPEDIQNVKPESQEILHADMIYINPIYASVITEEDLIPAEECEESKAALFSLETQPECSTVEEAGERMRELLKERVRDISIPYVTTEGVDAVPMMEIYEYAIQHTGNGAEGDYIRFQCVGWSAGWSGYSLMDELHVTITYTVSYLSDREQEETVNQRVREVLEELNLNSLSDYEKIKAVYDYVCRNVAYDYANLNDDSYQLKYTAYAALIDKTAVCQGYASLMYRLLLESRIDARIISGIGNEQPHAWNIARAGGWYYCLDATWDAGRSDYAYFMKGKNNFGDHQPMDRYLTDTFISNYVISNEDASPALTCGDANGDGSINSLDAVMIKRYLAGYEGLKIDLSAADVNADGRVNSLDAVKILQKLAGYEVVLGER